MSEFVFIAVNYNECNHTLKYIKSVNNILLKENDSIRIIIVDNNSSESDYNKINKYCQNYKNINTVRLESNIGYFSGLNQGIKLVDTEEDTYLIVGNNDLTFDKNFLINFKEIDISAKTFVIAPDIITKDGKHQNPHVINEVSLINKLKPRIYFLNYYIGQAFKFLNHFINKALLTTDDQKRVNRQMIIKRGIGACYLLTPYFFENYDLLDDRVFMWGEEALLSNQVEKAGGHTLYSPSLVVYHHESASVRKISSRKKYKMVRESYKIYKKYL